VNKLVTLGPGPNSLLGENGTAIIIHAGPDDNRTDPTGNSGGRIGCGVITK
jgi:Cu-Zn family superoxide dismutase